MKPFGDDEAVKSFAERIRPSKNKSTHSAAEEVTNSSKPLVIYVAETDHGDMSYSSLVRKIAEDCEDKGLRVRIFSEFPTQTLKVESQSWGQNYEEEKNKNSDEDKVRRQMQNLRNVPEEKTHKDTTEFLDKRLKKMGDLDGRFEVMMPGSFASYPDTMTPSQLFEERKGNIDNPEVLEIMKKEIETRKLEGRDNPGKWKGKDGQANGDLYDFNRFQTALHFKQIHAEMADDVRAGLSGSNADVVIMISGALHTPGLASQLESDFRGCPKLVVGNFPDKAKLTSEEFMSIGGRESCSQAGVITEFAVDATTKQASIPQAIQESLDGKSRTKNNGLSAEGVDQAAKGFVDRVREEREDSATSLGR